MSGSAGRGLLRRLAEDITILSDLPVASDCHPVGLGLPASHRWVCGKATLKLPTSDDGLVQLAALTSDEVYGLANEHRENAWRALLSTPTIAVALRVVDKTPFLARSIIIPTADAELRHLVLATAVADAEPAFADGTLNGQPVVGLAHVMLAVDNTSDLSSSAWMVADWSDHATRTLELLGSVVHSIDRGLTLTAVQDKRPRRARGRTAIARYPAATLLLPIDNTEPPGAVEALTSQARAAGFTLSVDRIDRVGSYHTRMATAALVDAAPSVLLVADVVVMHANEALGAYRRATRDPRIYPVHGDDFASRAASVRACLCQLAAVSSNHYPLGEHRPVVPGELGTPARNQPDFPVGNVIMRKRHDRYGIFVKDGDTEQWYARDWARHGAGEDERGPLGQFKRFHETATHLECEGSTDEAGVLLANKHESDIGFRIPKSELNHA